MRKIRVCCDRCGKFGDFINLSEDRRESWLVKNVFDAKGGEAMKFYTSDLHFDHSKMIEYENRPWKNVEYMNTALIENINELVKENDELYILGDFTLRDKREKIKQWRNQIKCKHVHLVVGNHDYFAKRAWASELFETVSSYKEIHDLGHKVVLCHYPIMYWNGMDDGPSEKSYHLYGHMHSRKDMQHTHPDAYNVGVDVQNYHPVTLAGLISNRVSKDDQYDF